MSTLFHLVRHADHGHVGKMLTGRAPGVPLSPTGRAEAARLARAMGARRLDALFSSPRRRARETAEAIAARSGLLPRIAPALDEIDFGDWTGRTFEVLAADPAWERWNACRDSAATPAGETMADVAARFAGLVEDLCAGFPGGTVVMVSHGDVIKAALCHYGGRPIHEIHDFDVASASVSTIAVDRHGGRVVAVNERPWERCWQSVAEAIP